MNKPINFLTGILAGLAPLVIAGIFGVLIYNELPNTAGIFIGVLLGLLAAWLGFEIFQKVQRVGIVDFVSVVVASPDLDNLEPTEGSKTKRRSPGELADLTHKNRHLFKGGSLKIFGDWHGEPYRNFLELLRIDYDEQEKQMVINFSKNTKLIIDEPDHILESPSVLKILSAKAVRIEFWHQKEHAPVERSYFKSYRVAGNCLETDTNIDWTDQQIDAAVGQDALIMFG
jgi:hypothetical protein